MNENKSFTDFVTGLLCGAAFGFSAGLDGSPTTQKIGFVIITVGIILRTIEFFTSRFKKMEKFKGTINRTASMFIVIGVIVMALPFELFK